VLHRLCLVLFIVLSMLAVPAPAQAATRCLALPGDVRYVAGTGYTQGDSEQVYVMLHGGGHELEWTVGPDLAADPWTPDRLCFETAGQAVYVRNIRRSGAIVAPHPITAVVIRAASVRDPARG